MRGIKRLLKLFLNSTTDVTIGKNVHMGVPVSVVHSVLKDYVNITPNSRIQYSTIGKRTSIGTNTRVNYANIGAYCSISWNVTIGATSHLIERLSMHAFTFQEQFGIADKFRRGGGI